MKHKFSVLAMLAVSTVTAVTVSAETKVKTLNPSAVEVAFDGDKTALLIDFYGPNIFRLFQDPAGGIVRNPEANPPARILVDNPRVNPGKITVNKKNGTATVSTSRIMLSFPSEGKTFTVTDLATGKTVIETIEPVEYTSKKPH